MKRNRRVTIMVTEKEYQYIERRAQLEKRSLSSHVWLKYRESINRENPDNGLVESNES